jgi:hypothetical protein
MYCFIGFEHKFFRSSCMLLYKYNTFCHHTLLLCGVTHQLRFHRFCSIFLVHELSGNLVYRSCQVSHDVLALLHNSQIAKLRLLRLVHAIDVLINAMVIGNLLKSCCISSIAKPSYLSTAGFPVFYTSCRGRSRPYHTLIKRRSTSI